MCEHDLFNFMQTLTYSKKGTSCAQKMKDNEKSTMLSRMSMDMRQFIANKPDSLFMDAFGADCILILKHMRYKYPA